MADLGPAGGVGAGGLDPSKAADTGKGLSQVGKADAGDVDAFQQAMGGAGVDGGAQTQQVSSPFDIQANRITDSANVQPQNIEGLKPETKEKVENFLNMGKNQDQKLIDMLNKMGEDGMSTSEAMEFQYLAGTLNVTTEIVGKGVNQTKEGVKQTIRQQ